MKKLPKSLFTSALFAFLFTAILSQTASAGLEIHPKRIVMEDRDRAASLDLLNDGDETIRYQIFFEVKTISPEGKIIDVENPDESGPYAKDMIRYSPRRVDIPAGGQQTIRLAARRPKDLPDGEYISHLVFKEIPNKTPARDKESDLPETVLQLNIKPTLRIAIPIIVRKGQLSATADMSELELIDEGEFGSVAFQLHRQGSASLYGAVEIYEQVNGAVGERIGYGKGVAAYTSLDQRRVRIFLSQKPSDRATGLLVRFDEAGEFGGNNLVEKVLKLK